MRAHPSTERRLRPRSGADLDARAPGGSFRVVEARQFHQRLRGLAGLEASELLPLLLPRCRSIHTFGMRAAIDVVWLDLGTDGRATVLGATACVPPRSMRSAPRGSGVRRATIAALELPAGAAAQLGLSPGAHLRLCRR
jgi:uncharacterized protein